MMPLPGHAVPLELINATIDNKVAEYKARQADQASADTVADTVAAARDAMANDPAAVARGLITQAELLEADAAAKREQAYALDPDSRPGRGRPSLPEDIKAQKLEEQKTKRRERDQRKAAEAKVEKKVSAIDAKVQAKLARDAARVESENVVTIKEKPLTKPKAKTPATAK